MLARTSWTALYLRSAQSGVDARLRVTLANNTSKPAMPKLNRDRRRHLIETTADILRQGYSSKFEYEGACRHGLRSGLCRDGWSWTEADAAAADIVAVSLRWIGAQRPSWREGQPEWTQDGHSPVEYTRCQHCGGNIPAGRGSRNGITVKYCSDLCGHMAYARSAAKLGETVSRAEYLARQAACTAKTMQIEVQCAQCMKMFRPGYAIKRRKFCSKECAIVGKPNPRRLPPQPCVGCGKMFKAKLASQKYCTPTCYQERGHAAVRGVEATCPVCKTIFRYHSPTQPKKHCSRKCAWVTRRRGLVCEAAG